MSSEEKNAPPSQRKLSKARDKGQVPASADLVGAIVSIIGILYVLGAWPGYLDVVLGSLRNAADVMRDPTEDKLIEGFSGLVGDLMRVMVPLFVIVSSAGLLANIVTKKGIVFSLHPITPDFTRVDPVTGMTRLFSKRNMIDLIAVLLRCTFWFLVAIFLIWFALPSLIMSPVCALPCIGEVTYSLIRDLMIVAIAMLLVFGFIDYLIQQKIFMDEQKMTKTEVKQERKEQQGSPEMTSHRKREHRRLLQGAGGQKAVRSASIIFVASDEAVALVFDPNTDPIPTIVAMGRGKHAETIMKVAERSKIAVEIDPEVTLELLKCKTGEIIPERLFRPVAYALVRHGCV
jgi:type III secretion protein U